MFCLCRLSLLSKFLLCVAISTFCCLLVCCLFFFPFACTYIFIGPCLCPSHMYRTVVPCVYRCNWSALHQFFSLAIHLSTSHLFLDPVLYLLILMMPISICLCLMLVLVSTPVWFYVFVAISEFVSILDARAFVLLSSSNGFLTNLVLLLIQVAATVDFAILASQLQLLCYHVDCHVCIIHKLHIAPSTCEQHYGPLLLQSNSSSTIHSTPSQIVFTCKQPKNRSTIEIH